MGVIREAKVAISSITITGTYMDRYGYDSGNGVTYDSVAEFDISKTFTRVSLAAVIARVNGAAVTKYLCDPFQLYDKLTEGEFLLIYDNCRCPAHIEIICNWDLLEETFDAGGGQRTVELEGAIPEGSGAFSVQIGIKSIDFSRPCICGQGPEGVMFMPRSYEFFDTLYCWDVELSDDEEIIGGEFIGADGDGALMMFNVELHWRASYSGDPIGTGNQVIMFNMHVSGENSGSLAPTLMGTVDAQINMVNMPMFSVSGPVTDDFAIEWDDEDAPAGTVGFGEFTLSASFG